MPKPLVSVVIPVHNRSTAIIDAIESVAGQTYEHVEILVVDDASSDDTVAVVERLAHPKVKLLRHEVNQYAGAARNTGMKHARGELIAFLDSDDTWHPEKLEKQVDLLHSNQEAGFCVCGVLLKAGRGYREKAMLPKFDSHPTDRLFLMMTGRVFIITSTLVVRKNVAEQIGDMDVSLRRNQDIDYFIRMLTITDGVAVEEPLVEFFPNFSPPSLELVEKSNQQLLSKHTKTFESLGRSKARAIPAFYWFRHGQRHLERGSLSEGLRWMSRGIAKNPFLPFRQYLAAAVKVLKRTAGFKKRFDKEIELDNDENAS